MGAVHISIRENATQPVIVDWAGWQAKMASIVLWIQCRDVHSPHCKATFQATNFSKILIIPGLYTLIFLNYWTALFFLGGGGGGGAEVQFLRDLLTNIHKLELTIDQRPFESRQQGQKYFGNFNKCRWDKIAKRERSTHAAGLRQRDIFCFRELVFFPFSSDVYRGQKEQTKNNEYTKQSVKTRLSTVRVVWMACLCEHGWQTTQYACANVCCVRLNIVRYATNDFCLHKTGFKTWMYIASRMLTFRWCFDRQRASTLKSVSAYARQHSLFAAKWQAIADG